MTSDDTFDLDLKKIKSAYKRASKDRYKRYKNGYRADRWMFQAGMIAIFAWLFFIAYWYHFDMDYYKCDDPAGFGVVHPLDYGGELHGQREIISQSPGCLNPFYKPSLKWKTQQYLPPGEYGTKLGPMFESGFYVPILIILILVALNHYINNNPMRRRK